ncbi:MAG: exonuclease subunit SbcD, partial [Sphaerochaetaceae bacterium]|nr:exonuclease subunit SbcD [Sphaerochaetaceae bacterium]
MSRLLHTSDWHLGAPLAGEVRTDHFQTMLEGLLKLICERKVTCLLVAGDVFDVSSPPVSAQNQYFDFLARLKDTPCSEVVIISGNHDSARFLAAPAAPLGRLGIHVVSGTETDSSLVPVGTDTVVLAVPYLRDGSLGTIPGTSEAERSANFIQMVREYLAGLSSVA